MDHHQKANQILLGCTYNNYNYYHQIANPIIYQNVSVN